MAAARAREACGIPGTSVHTTYLCRDKPAMKEALRAAGVPCARSTGARSGHDVREFAAEVGFPIILKPAAGAGASGAERVDGPDELDGRDRPQRRRPRAEVAVEEFVDGHEGFYDTISIDGARRRSSSSRTTTPTSSRRCGHGGSRRSSSRPTASTAPGYGELRELGQRVITALGIGTSATHMEWFAGSKGLYFSEIGCRPPGVRVLGPLRRRQRLRHLPRVGQRPSSTVGSASRRRAASPPG